MKMQTMVSYKEGLRDGIPIALGYLGVSFTFGIMGSAGGLFWWETVLISMLNLTSAGQFAGLNIMLACGSMVEMAMAQLVINLRYSLMGIALSQKTEERFTGLYRWILGFGITDEIFAVSMNRKVPVRRSYFFGLMTLPYLGWALGTLIGAVCGAILPDMVVGALSVAIYGMFIAIVVPDLPGNKGNILVVGVAIALSCLFAYVPALKDLSVGFVVIICGVAASAVGAFFFPIREEETEENRTGEEGVEHGV